MCAPPCTCLSIESTCRLTPKQTDAKTGTHGRSAKCQVRHCVACRWNRIRKVPGPSVLLLHSVSHHFKDAPVSSVGFQTASQPLKLPRCAAVRLINSWMDAPRHGYKPTRSRNSSTFGVSLPHCMIQSVKSSNKGGACGFGKPKCCLCVDALARDFRTLRPNRRWGGWSLPQD